MNLKLVGDFPAEPQTHRLDYVFWRSNDWIYPAHPEAVPPPNTDVLTLEQVADCFEPSGGDIDFAMIWCNQIGPAIPKERWPHEPGETEFRDRLAKQGRWPKDLSGVIGSIGVRKFQLRAAATAKEV